jgi:hypothetical protein
MLPFRHSFILTEMKREYREPRDLMSRGDELASRCGDKAGLDTLNKATSLEKAVQLELVSSMTLLQFFSQAIWRA